MSDVFDEIAEVIPERYPNGRYFWLSFAQRVRHRFEGVPGPDNVGWFVEECLRAGVRAVPVLRRNTRWEKDAPDRTKKDERRVYEIRIRLGLFYAAALRYLIHGVARVQARSGDEVWHGLTEEGQPFSEFAAGREDEVEVEWKNAAPSYGLSVLTLQVFVEPEEMLLLTPELAQEVYDHAGPAGPAGLFGLMLVADGQEDKPSVDVARVFLHALAEAVDEKALKVNSKRGGHVFITPEFWLLTTPIGVDCMIDFIGSRRGTRRFEFSRHEVFEALRDGGYLVGDLEKEDTPLCELKARRWRKPGKLRGLCIAAVPLFSVPNAPLFLGRVNLKEE